ncbi:MAG: cation transporter [Acidimicrobiia bacterium]
MVKGEPEATLTRRAFALEGLTVAWNTVEAAVAVIAGVAAGSIALIGFGLDSLIEVFAAGVVIWQLRGGSEERERLALRLIAGSFFALAAYVSIEALRDLLLGHEPGTSTPGVVLAAVSLAVMPSLALAKRRTGQRLGNPVLVADSTETLLCAYLSAILLVGLALNATVGWWWADPLAGLGIAYFAVREGREAWEGEEGEES